MSTVQHPTGAEPVVPGARVQESLHDSPEFVELRSRFRRFVFPVTVGFLVWYFLYVLAACYAPGFMATKLVGNINVALVFGLLQFASTFGIAIWYSKRAARDLDPLAEQLRLAHDGGRR